MRARAAALLLCLAGCTMAHQDQDTAATSPGTRYVIGAPYLAGGEWQYPRVFGSYDRTGLAMVIPPDAPALTADGAAFSQDGLTAQSPILPLPSLVEVTDLGTGRRMTVLVNDRGPALAGRVLAVTRRVAALLGMPEEETAKVRVRLLPGRSAALQDALGAGPDLAAAPVADVRADPLPPPPGIRGSAGTAGTAFAADRPAPRAAPAMPDGAVTQTAPSPGPLYVAMGGFGSSAAAFAMRRRLTGFDAAVVPEAGGGRTLYAVHLGPYHSAAAADAALQAVLARGISDPEIIVR